MLVDGCIVILVGMNIVIRLGGADRWMLDVSDVHDSGDGCSVDSRYSGCQALSAVGIVDALRGDVIYRSSTASTHDSDTV